MRGREQAAGGAFSETRRRVQAAGPAVRGRSHGRREKEGGRFANKGGTAEA